MRPQVADQPVSAVEIGNMWAGYRAKSGRGWRRKEILWALSDVSMSVSAGETVGIIGANGSGKSTLLECITGVMKPAAGTLVTRGRVASLVDLSAGFHRELSGKENALVSGVLSGLSRAEVRNRYESIVDFAELSEQTMNSPLLTYSTGMWLRLGFSIAVHADPSILLVDEVLAVGDEAFQQKCIQRVEDMRGTGCAIVIVSHDLALVEARSNRAGVLERGQLRFLGAPEAAIRMYHDLSGGKFEEQDFSRDALYRKNAARQLRQREKARR